MLVKNPHSQVTSQTMESEGAMRQQSAFYGHSYTQYMWEKIVYIRFCRHRLFTPYSCPGCGLDLISLLLLLPLVWICVWAVNRWHAQRRHGFNH